jgi:hypothetical protein
MVHDTIGFINRDGKPKKMDVYRGRNAYDRTGGDYPSEATA